MLWVLTILYYCCFIHIVTAQNDNDSDYEENARLNYNLPFIIVPVVVFILFIIGIIFGAYIVYRARYHGAFACCSLRMRYKPNYVCDEEAVKDASLPSYTPTPHPSTAPPNYDDALDDEVVKSPDKVPLIP